MKIAFMLILLLLRLVTVIIWTGITIAWIWRPEFQTIQNLGYLVIVSTALIMKVEIKIKEEM